MKTVKYFMLIAAAFVLAACVEDDVYAGPSTIETVTADVAAPTSSDAVTVTATFSGLQAPRKVTLTYIINDVPTEVEMVANGDTYTGTIPAQPDGTAVKYFVTIVNAAGYTTVSAEKEYIVGDPPADYTKLKLNELYGAADTDEGKFIEIYNTGDDPIKLKGVVLKKDGSDTWTGIEGEVIPAHGVWAVVGAKGTTERGFSSGFSNKKSVLVELYDPNGTQIDKFQRGEEGDGWGNQSLPKITGSWSRVPDGTGNWQVTDPTVNALNATTGTDDPNVVQ